MISQLEIVISAAVTKQPDEFAHSQNKLLQFYATCLLLSYPQHEELGRILWFRYYLLLILRVTSTAIKLQPTVLRSVSVPL